MACACASRAGSAFYLLRRLFFRSDSRPTGHLKPQVWIALDSCQNLTRHTVIDFTGMSGFYWIADHDLKGSLGEMQSALRSKRSDGRIQRALHAVPLRFH